MKIKRFLGLKSETRCDRCHDKIGQVLVVR